MSNESFPYEAEQALLGGLMLDNSAMARIEPALEPSQFEGPQHGEIYSAICSLLNDQQPADPITVGERLAQATDGTDRGEALRYLLALSNSVPTASNIAGYAKIIHKRAAKRANKTALAAVVAMFAQATDAREALAEAQRIIDEANLPALPSCWRGPNVARVGTGLLNRELGKEEFIVEGLLPVDAVGLVAVGGTGKSTFLLWVATCVTLGKSPAPGATVMRPGPVLYVSAEDREATISRRLQSVCRAAGLSTAEGDEVAEQFYIEDVSGTDVRLVVDQHGELHATPGVDDLIEQYRGSGLSLVVLDPLSLLGPGERSVNDGMAATMRAARRISQQLNCAVIVVHHETKASSREGVHDQYAGRGGAAFADNSRGNWQLFTASTAVVEHGKKKWNLPRGWSVEDIDAGNVLVWLVHKISYARRDPRPIWVLRQGWSYQTAFAVPVDGDEIADEQQAMAEKKIVELIAADLHVKPPMRYSKRTLAEACMAKRITSRDTARHLVDRMVQRTVLIEMPLPQGAVRGSFTHYLVPASQPQLADLGRD